MSQMKHLMDTVANELGIKDPNDPRVRGECERRLLPAKYPECPNYIHPRCYVDPATDEGYEGSAMCDLVDKYCLVEYGNDCEIYQEWLKEGEVDVSLSTH